MEISTSQKIKTGAFVIGSLVLLLILIFLIGQQKNMFGGTFSVKARFKTISGLKEGNYVRFAGINVGSVDNISIVNDTTVSVVMVLQNKIKPFIREDVLASIGSDGLMGDKLVVISPGSANARPVKNGALIGASNPVDVDHIINNLSKISDHAEVMTSSLSNVMTKIDNGEGTLGRLINSDKLMNTLQGTLTSAQETVGSVKKTASSVTDNMDAVKHSFLLRGYFRRREKKRIKDSTDRAKKMQSPEATKQQNN